MNSMMKARVLTVVMLILGILMVVGSTMSIFSTSVFPFDGLAGTDAAVAGVAFGVGIAVASFNPERHVTWVRAAILYAALVIVYRIIFGLAWGTWGQPAPLVLAILFGLTLIFLYPRRSELMPSTSMTSEGPSRPAAAH
jgi:peptidoglycan/LPS O-acetylase OafA/YrhL